MPALEMRCALSLGAANVFMQFDSGYPYRMAPKPVFRPHGSYSARIEGRILVCIATGSWNIEMQQEAIRRSAPEIARLEATGYWGCLVEARKNLVTSRAVLEAGRDAIQSGGLSRLACLAWVISPDLEGYRLMMPLYRDLYAGVVRSSIFPAVAEARTWIETVLAGRNAAISC